MSSIDILDEVRKCGSQEIISDIEEVIKTKSTKGHSKNSGANKNLDISASSEGMLTPECNDDDNLKEMTASDYEKYKKAYIKTTGKIIEDALYNFSLHCKYEHLAHSFVLDPEDNTYLKENVFTENE
ncbi:17426_t:CDS:2 [Entrophospora sp. SA101]|nr:17426_t:CDS:2 [Entrophospora sp. SA101]CAJ0916503.1 20197_t:CDS:2 [Entrophospora sp. SA101]